MCHNPHTATGLILWVKAGRVADGWAAETVLEAHRAAATFKEASVGVAGRLQTANSISDFGVFGETLRKMLRGSKRTGYFRIPLVGIHPVYIGDDLRQRLRGGCGFSLRCRKCAICTNIADGKRGDKCGKKN